VLGMEWWAGTVVKSSLFRFMGSEMSWYSRMIIPYLRRN
jgi:hypothetical protein